MSSTSARMNTWTTLNEQGTNKLTYWPQVNPSPLTVSLPHKSPNIGSLEIVIVNSTPLDIAVSEVEFLIPIGLDGDVLTSTTSGILTAVSDSIQWKIIPPGLITSGKAKYRLLPNIEAETAVTIPKGKSVSVQIYGFTTNATPGTPTIEIIEIINSVRVTTSCSVTIFPWGFAFSDLVANVRDGGALIPVAQVDREKPVILSWQSSVVDTGSYTVYCSTNQGQTTYPVSTPGEWTSPSLTADTVFTLVVSVKNTAGVKLYASMSLAVAVRNPDLIVTSLDVLKSTTLRGDLTVGSAALPPKLTVYSSPLVIDAGGNVEIKGNRLTFGAGTQSLVVDKTQGLSITGPLSVTDALSVSNGLKMGSANAVIQRGDGNITTHDLGLYSNNPTNWIRLVTNNSPIKFFTDGGNGTNPTLTINTDGTIDNINVNASGGSAAKLRLSSPSYTDNSGDNTAEISNDITKNFGALMLVGNSSRKAGGPRWVQAWDNLEVKGDLFVTGWIYKYWNDTKRYEYLGGGGGYRWCEWHAPSDLRLKRDVEPVPSALDKVRHLRGVTFYWNEDALQHFTRNIETTLSAGPNATESESQKFWQEERDKRRNQLSTTQVGVLAQDVEAVLPEAVTTDADGYKTVRYDNLIPLLIEAIKEQDQLAARQQAEIERLKLAVGIGE